MDFNELISESLITLTLNKVRTGLAMLGVIIGIGSVIALISLGQSSQRSITNQIQSLGSNLLTVSPGSQMSGAVRGGGNVTSLTYDDAKAILDSPSVTTIKLVSAEYSSRAQIVAGKNNTNTSVVGTLPSYTEIRNIKISSGTFITQRNVDAMNKVAVIGPETSTDLFGENVNPVGKTIRINGQVFNIIGITVSKGGSGFNNQDDIVYVPLTTAQKLIFGVDHVSSISVSALNEKDMEKAKTELTNLLLTRHKIKNSSQADFRIMSQEEILSTVSEVTGTFTTLLTGIAAISLLVGGIGIMNIMLVTVTERTREIGLRKALGAKNKTITTQFLTEAVMITFIGGLIGTFLGILLSFVLSKVMNITFIFSISPIILAFGVSAGVGVLFGWYPAQKAAKLEPIEALRYE
jgi:putative ABC transport system permease protein